MHDSEKRIALTGFMGVGKSSVARHLASFLGCERTDLDYCIEQLEQRTISEIIEADGLPAYRRIESETLFNVLNDVKPKVLSLGGGTWTIPENRELIKRNGVTVVWLESSFDHCWMNIKFSRKERPLAKNKRDARKLFEERQKSYCLADWHFIIRPEFTSFDVAKSIFDEFFS
jgi:shikimate kinase